MNLSGLLQRAQKLAIDNSPTILTGVAVAGTAMTAVLTAKATIRAVELIQNEERDARLSTGDHTYETHAKRKVELTWRLYIPPVTTGLLTVTCIIGANRIGTRRAAAVAAAYTLSEQAFSEYREKVVEKLGAKKEQAVRDEIAQDRVVRRPVEENRVIIVDGKSVLCLEAFTGRYFLTDMETLRQAQNDVNHQINSSYYASLSDFYDRIGLDHTSYSEEVGWNADKLLELSFSSVLTDSGKPVLVMDYEVVPIRGYARVQ